MNTIKVHDIDQVEEITLAEDTLLVSLTGNRKIVSLHHFNDHSPVLKNGKDSTNKQGDNAGAEGEKAVIQLLKSSGIPKEDIFLPTKVKTSKGDYEMWDGAFRFNGNLVLLQIKTRLIIRDEESQRNWMTQSATAARRQIRNSHKMAASRRTILSTNLAGKKEKLNLKSYNVRYLIVLAVNTIIPARPSRFVVPPTPDMPYPGSTITLKELKDLCAFLPAEEAFTYLTTQEPTVPYNLGFELVRYAHKLGLKENETLILK